LKQHKHHKHHRKIVNFLIRPRAQLKIVALYSVSILGLVVSFEIFTLYRFSNITKVMTNYYELPEKTKTILLKVVEEFMWDHIIQTLIFSIFVVAMLIVITHRTYGPIIAIKRFIRQLIAHDYSAPLHIRKKDEFHDVVRLLNELENKLKHEGD